MKSQLKNILIGILVFVIGFIVVGFFSSSKVIMLSYHTMQLLHILLYIWLVLIQYALVSSLTH